MSEEFNDRLTALICAYNEEDLLPGCLESLVGKVDRIVLADGRYKMFPGDSDSSTDRTIEIAESFGCDIITAPIGGWETEHAKRTALVRSGVLGDMYLVIDADERLMGGTRLRDFYGDYSMAIVGVEGTPGRSDAVRLFAHTDGMEYRWHFGLFREGGRPVLRSSDNLGQGVAWLAHHHAERDSERVALDKEYEALLVPFEQSLGAYG